MKKIFTLAIGLLFTAALFAADRRPSVTINNSKNYKIVIDGKSYFASNNNINLSSMYGGRHTIQVFELKKGFRARGEKMVDSSVFQLGRNDMTITIDRFGQINIREDGAQPRRVVQPPRRF